VWTKYYPSLYSAGNKTDFILEEVNLAQKDMRDVRLSEREPELRLRREEITYSLQSSRGKFVPCPFLPDGNSLAFHSIRIYWRILFLIN
jgi:hypothetical protein